MSPQLKDSIVPKIDDPPVKASQIAESCCSPSELVISVPSRPDDETTSPRMTRRNSPCVACIEHLINWLPTDEGVMFCEEGNGNGTCARCESAGLECKSSHGTVKKPAKRLHTALSQNNRDSDSIKSLQSKVRENLKAESDRELEETRDQAINEIGNNMGNFLNAMCRDNKLKGFERGMELASMTVKDCKGSCSSLLWGCAMGTKATMLIAHGGDEEMEEPAMPVRKGKKSKGIKL